MTQNLVLETAPSGARAGLMYAGRLLEFVSAPRTQGVEDRIFLARVRRTEPKLNAAFVDCGLSAPAWLGARDARFIAGAPSSAGIAGQLTEGQTVLVQGRREAAGGKGPRVTGDITLAGAHILLRPRRQGADVSGRLARTPDGAGQRERALRLFPQGGVVLRSAARRTSDAVLLAEAERLRRVWETVEIRARTARAPACLYDPHPVERLLARWSGADLERIVAGDRAAYLRARAWLEQCAPPLIDQLEHVPGAFAALGAEEQIEAALGRSVPLANGGSLIIEPTHALVAIDVNGAGRAALEVNLEAAVEIALQVRLRRLGGMIVIDFIDLPHRRERERLIAALRRAFEDDPAPVQILPAAPLGLVHLSRRREGPALHEELLRPCPSCAGEGRQPALPVRAEELVRTLAASAPVRVEVALAPDLEQYLSGEAADFWRECLQCHGREVSVTADPALAPGEFRVREIM